MASGPTFMHQWCRLWKFVVFSTVATMMAMGGGGDAMELGFMHRYNRSQLQLQPARSLRSEEPGGPPAVLPWDELFLPDDSALEGDLVEPYGGGLPVAGTSRQDRDSGVSYQPLCQTQRNRVELNDGVYEYRPPHYHEVLCRQAAAASREQQQQQQDREAADALSLRASSVVTKQMCVHPGFTCVQRYQKVWLTRRRYESSCWEMVTRTVPSGCECMWPENRFGDISRHY
ncbi:uncharacterized protein LOC126108922 isoform X3 [Schistocerca cancellata]|uniref:uncharacterized protein LOC126108922 isoform X3 n=1 Tax=Schistocerca cancellata TaxID=274614 RepID=UPI0021186114|nr:uncharacterized protein LOC126108922 isoform X3 [Schistocerca cancellata]